MGKYIPRFKNSRKINEEVDKLFKLENSTIHIPISYKGVVMGKNETVEDLIKEVIDLHIRLNWLTYDNEVLNTILKILNQSQNFTEEELKNMRCRMLIKYSKEGIDELKRVAIDLIDGFANADETIDLIHKFEDELGDIEEKYDAKIDSTYEDIKCLIEEIIKEIKRIKSQGETMQSSGLKRFFTRQIIPFQVLLLGALTYFTNFAEKLDLTNAFLIWFFFSVSGVWALVSFHKRKPSFAKDLEE